MGYSFRRVIALIILLLPSTLVYAAPDNPPKTRVLLLESKSSRVSSTFSAHLRTSIHLRNDQIDVVRLDIEQPGLKLNAPLVITIGKDALNFTLSSGYQGSILATLISANQYQSLLSQHKDHRAKQVTAVFHQAPIIRQMLLFKELNPAGKRLGVLITPDEQNRIESLKRTAYKLNLILEYEVVSRPADLSRNLIKLINRTDAIIATHNNTIYNRSTIKSILLTLYRHNKFLIGSDKNFIRAGSIATTYTSMQQLLDELVDEVSYFMRNKQKLRSTRYSQRFMVAFNKDVARSLNLTIKDNRHYIDAIQATELTLGEKELYE